MKTAKEFINTFQDEFRENGGGVVNQLMIAYAREAIKTDRKNVAKHAEAYLKESLMTQQRVVAIVDKSSIINAPEIELK